MTAAYLGAYQTVHTTTADPSALVLMLFDGAGRFLRQARRALDQGDVPRFGEAVCRAQAVIAELSDVLDRESGAEAAAGLAGLYDFMLRHLSQGLMKKSGRHLDEVLVPLTTLRDGFQSAVEASRG